MASLPVLLAAADGGLSGSAVRGVVTSGAQGSAAAVPPGLEQTVAAAAQQMLHGLDMAAQAAQSVGIATEQAAASLAEPASTLGQSSFSWGSYIQAVGILFLLVAVLWLAVWLAAVSASSIFCRVRGRFRAMPWSWRPSSRLGRVKA